MTHGKTTNETDVQSIEIDGILEQITNILLKASKTTSITRVEYQRDDLNSSDTFNFETRMTSGFDEWLERDLKEIGIKMSAIYPRESGFYIIFRRDE